MRHSETSIPCTLTTCSPGYLFLGSRLGDSVFFQYNREAIENGDESEEPQAKKARAEDTAEGGSNGPDEDDEFLYGGDENAEPVEAKVLVGQILVTEVSLYISDAESAH